MATWDDDTRPNFNQVAGGMLYIASCLDELIKRADEDTDLTILLDTRDWLRDRANLFSPPGEPQEGYQGADVVSLDAWREWRRIEKRQA